MPPAHSRISRLAWLAGVVDTCGYLCVQRSPRGHRWQSPRWLPTGSAPLVAAIKSATGSRTNQITGHRLQQILAEVLPYLRVRRHVAELILRWPVLASGKKLTQAQFALQNKIAAQLARTVNKRRGKSQRRKISDHANAITAAGLTYEK